MATTSDAVAVLEALQQLQDLGEAADVLLAPASGGGLIGGIGLAFEALSPSTKIYAVEPEGYDDYVQSLAAGHPVSVKPTKPSLLDALMSPAPGEMTFALNKKTLAGALTVTDDEALAAVLAGKLAVAGQTVVVVASGGNVDSETYRRAIA